MKVLVTGGTGSIGRPLVRRLCEAGYSVRALVRPVTDTHPLNVNDVEVVRGDIRDAAAVEQAVRGCTHVYHLAGITSRHCARRHEYEAINVRGTENVVRAAIRANVERLVYAGSAGIHRNNHRLSIDETDAPNPNSHYRKTKLAGETIVLSGYREHGLPVVAARLSGVYGPDMLNWLGIFRAVATGRFRMIGTGQARRHIGYISDVVDGLLRCAETPGIIGESYFITGSEPVTVKHLLETIAEEMSIPQPSRRLPDWPYRAFHRMCGVVFDRFGFELPYAHRYTLFLEDQAFNINKARDHLGYRPVVSLRQGIQQSVAWYQANGYLS